MGARMVGTTTEEQNRNAPTQLSVVYSVSQHEYTPKLSLEQALPDQEIMINPYFE
jgi:hypothetical protein